MFIHLHTPLFVVLFIIFAAVRDLPASTMIPLTAISTTSIKNPPTGTLPSPEIFALDNGTKWTVDYIGDTQFTSTLSRRHLGGDKARSSVLGEKVIWNFGDMVCADTTTGKSNWSICGFSMGPAFYGTDQVTVVNTDGIENVYDATFAKPWEGDESPVAPQTAWGMDTSNIAAINDSVGIAYVWEIWRGAANGSIVDRGNGVVAVTNGIDLPLATRLGPLLTGPDAIQLGLLAILRDGEYIYSYSVGGASGLIVGRVVAGDEAFDAGKYEFLQYSSNASASPVWISGQGIPSSSSNGRYGMTTAQEGGIFGCAVYGSIFYSNYLNKYMLFCGIFENFYNFYTADDPWGPWSAEYQILKGVRGYGNHAHPEFSPGGSHREVFVSQGPDGPLNMWKFTLNYD